MKKNILFFIVIIFELLVLSDFDIMAQNKDDNSKWIKQDQCYKCHKDNGNLPADYSQNDIHRKLLCSSCHGGNPNAADMDVAMDPSKGFKGVPAKKDIPKFCGSCHSNIEIMRTYQPRIATDQEMQYYTSMHGKKLMSGDNNVAQCASCHTAHNILPVKDPRATVYKLNVPATCNKCHGNADLMAKYKLPHNVLDQYTKSVHGVALFEKNDTGAPACNDCHGNHGAMPPGISSISRVCGTCHVKNMEYFDLSAMQKSFEKKGFHGCEQCHNNHAISKPSDEMLGVSGNSKCITCHKPGDAGYKTAAALRNYIDDLNKNYDLANTKLAEVKQKGMNDIDIGFLLQDAKQNIIQTRTKMHTFDSTKVGESFKDGMEISNKAIFYADREISEYSSRRTGFAAATFIILIFIFALFLKIRERGKKKEEINF